VKVKPVLMYGNFAKHKPGRRYPDVEVFRRLEQNLRKAGKVLPTALQKPDCPRTKINEHTLIVTAAREFWISLSDISRDLELSQPKALEVLLDSQLN
jgi:hypothetical protein